MRTKTAKRLKKMAKNLGVAGVGGGTVAFVGALTTEGGALDWAFSVAALLWLIAQAWDEIKLDVEFGS